MANEQKKLSELPTSNSVVGTDRILILKDPAGSPSTRTVSFSNFTNSISFSNSTKRGVVLTSNCFSVNSTGFLNISFPGPYTNDSSAAANSISVGGIYYDTSGVVRIRIS